MNQILNKEPTELFYTERKVFIKKVDTKTDWSFDLGMFSEQAPKYVIVGFQNRNNIESQTHDNATFDLLPISSAVCIIGSQNYTDKMITCDYDRNNYHEAYYEMESFFRNHTETNILKPFISLNLFRSIYNFYIFDITKQKEHIAAQLLGLEFKISAAIDVSDNIVYPLVLTNELVGHNSDRQRHFDLL